MRSTQARSSLVVVLLLLLVVLVFVSRQRQEEGGRAGAESVPEKTERESMGMRAAPDALREWMRSGGDREEGVRLAKERRSWMSDLMRSAPERVRELALNHAEYAALPREVREWVEEPFSVAGLLEVKIFCGGSGESRVEYTLEDEVGRRWEVIDGGEARVGVTKTNVPVQGVRLDDAVVLEPGVFEVVEGENAAWVRENWELGQARENQCFESGKPIAREGVTAVAGGRVFRFENREALSRVEAALLNADGRPGPEAASAWLLKEASGGEGGEFPYAQLEEEAETAALASTTGSKTAFFLLADFSDEPGAPVSGIQLEQNVDMDVSAALREYSYEKTSVDGTVSNATVRLLSPSSDYVGGGAPKDEDDIRSEAIAGWIALGNPDPVPLYDTVCVVFPSIGYTWAGLATVGGTKMWLQNTVSAEVILHEFGHNYGLRHANYWVHDFTDAASTDPVDPGGANEEYGDEFDVMGDGSVAEGHFTVAGKQFLAWIGAPAWMDLAGASDNGTYRIHRFDHVDGNGMQGLRIAKAATSDHYWIGYRKEYLGGQAFDRGAYLLWERGAGTPSRNQTWLVDSTPLSDLGKNDAPVTLGRTYSDMASDVHITTVGAGGAGASAYLDVAVQFGPFPGNGAPTGSLSGATTADARSTVLFSVSATDPNGDPLAYAWDFGDGQVHQNAPSVAQEWTSGGSYPVSVTISDMKGGSLTLSQTVTVSDPLTNWTARTSGTALDLYGIVGNGTHVVAVGDDGVILRSTDGATWENRTPGGFLANARFHDVCWDGSQFLLAGYDYDSSISNWEGVIYSSPNGMSWTRVHETNVGDTRLYGIATDGAGTVVAVGREGVVLRRPPGGSWTTVSAGVPTTHLLQDVEFGAGYFILVGHTTTPSFNGDVRVMRSTDGSSWTDFSSGSGLASFQDFRTIHYTGERFVAGGFVSWARYSEDLGETFATTQSGDYLDPTGFATGGGVVYGVGTNYSAGNTDIDLVSLDGKSWSVLSPGSLPDRNGIVYFGGTFLSVGDGGSIRQSGTVVINEGYDYWASVYFPGGGADALADANPDGDWADNLTEYSLGGDPTLEGSAPQKPHIYADNDGYLAMDVYRLKKQPDVTYEVLCSLDLDIWVTSGLITLADSETLLQVRSATLVPAAGAEFMKLGLTK